MEYYDQCQCLYCDQCRRDVNKSREGLSYVRRMRVSSFERSVRFRGLKQWHEEDSDFKVEMYRSWIGNWVDPQGQYEHKINRNPFA